MISLGAMENHDVNLCETESGVLDWSYTEPLDTLRRARAQRHSILSDDNWASDDS